MGASTYRNMYRISSSRLKGWDYDAAGYYFITICTKDRHLWFGEVRDSDVRRSYLGEIAYQYWLDIPKHFHQVSLDEYIIMPNHLHGIIIINVPEFHLSSVPAQPLVETQHAASLLNEQNQPPIQARQKSLPKSGSISAIVRSYKSAVTRWAGENGYREFRWQPRFYDHIIRHPQSLDKIRLYIWQNPAEWSDDENYIESSK